MMRKYIYYLVLFPLVVFANPNVVVSTIDKSLDLGMSINYPDTSINLSLSDFLAQPSGGGGGTFSIKNNVLSLSIVGSWTATKFKVGVIKNLNISPALPNMELGQIMVNSDESPSGVFAKIESNNLVFYSPFYLTGINASLSAPVTGGVSGYKVSLPNLYVCNPSGGGGASGSITITNGLATLNISGGWSSTCNLKTGQMVYLATTPISNVELGIIKDGTRETNFRAKIEGNWLIFYNAEVPPAFVSLCDFNIIKDLDEENNSYNLDSLGDYPDFYQSLTTSDFILTGSGGGGGSISIVNNLFSVSFGGSCSPQKMKTGVIKTLTVSPALPNMELGPILTGTAGVNNGYFAKIENNSLIFYSPFFSTNIGTTVSTAISGGAPGVNSSFTLPPLYACPTSGGGGSSGNFSIANGIATLYISGGWSSTCNLKLGQIIQLNGVSIPNTELGILNNGTVATAYRAKIESNWLVFYTTETVPALPSAFSLNFKKVFGNSVVKPDKFSHWTHTISYDSKGSPIGSSRIYFDDLGKSNVSLSMDFVSNKIWGTETTYDSYGREDKTSYVTPSILTTFKKVGFLTFGTNYHSANNNLTQYYSDANTLEPYQATATHPFSEVMYDELNPGNTVKVVGGNKIDGDWKTGFSYTLPAAQEMYYAFGAAYFDGDMQAQGEVVVTKFFKTVVQDANGVENVSFSDGEGRILASGTSGRGSAYPVVSLIGTQGFIDIHVPLGVSPAALIGSASDYKIYNLKTGALHTGSLLGGNFYRIEAVVVPTAEPVAYITSGGGVTYSAGAKGVTYTVNYADFALNYYDKTGRLSKTIQPKGYQNNTSIVAVPTHTLATTFGYNALDQLTTVTSPDEGTSRFTYRKDGQIRYSQNALQNDTKVSYTDYDGLGRPIESGVITGSAGIWTSAIANPDGTLLTGIRSEQTFTIYDDYKDFTTSYAVPANLDLAAIITSKGLNAAQYVPNNLSGNVAVTFNDTSFTWYSYDLYGRLEWMVQNLIGFGLKTVHYYYDHNGNVKKVIYQKDLASEMFVHQYTYQVDGALLTVATSVDNVTFKEHAKYKYYQTGELKRVELAQGLQGIDYVYTLGGALKSINHPSLEKANDPGGDANDVFGITLDYYNGDYLRSNRNISTSPTVAGLNQDNYDGNIKASRWSNRQKDVPDPSNEASATNKAQQRGYMYNYNPNKWLTQTSFGNVSGNAISPATAFKEGNITYDKNGNILSLQRAKEDGTVIDNFTYNYGNGNNQLTHVDDAVVGNADIQDLKDQNTNNYGYDVLGRMTSNLAEGLTYTYNTQGLVTQIKKGTQLTVNLKYNERGHRIRKEVITNKGTGSITTDTEYNVVDLSGNVMGVYFERTGTVERPITLYQKENPIFGTSRLGVYTRATKSGAIARTSYEITDHLGNVRAVIQENPNLFSILLSYADYYAFGEQLPSRNTTSDYRYAFQGQELDKETGMEAFQLRLWDGRIGRWLSPDPYGQYASPYLGMGNNPVNMIDPDGGLTIDPPVKPTELKEVVVFSGKGSSNSNWLQQIRGITRNWANQNIRIPIDKYLAEFRNGVAAARQVNREILHENLSPLYKLQGQFGAGTGAGLMAGRNLMYSSASKVGGLADDVAKTFQFGRYTEQTLEESIVLSRYYDDVNAFAKGRFMTNSTSSFKFLDRMRLALRPSWNGMTKVAHWEIPAGTTVYKGKAAMQFPWLGGKTQYFVPLLDNVTQVFK